MPVQFFQDVLIQRCHGAEIRLVCHVIQVQDGTGAIGDANAMPLSTLNHVAVGIADSPRHWLDMAFLEAIWID